MLEIVAGKHWWRNHSIYFWLWGKISHVLQKLGIFRLKGFWSCLIPSMSLSVIGAKHKDNDIWGWLNHLHPVFGLRILLEIRILLVANTDRSPWASKVPNLYLSVVVSFPIEHTRHVHWPRSVSYGVARDHNTKMIFFNRWHFLDFKKCIMKISCLPIFGLCEAYS